MIRLLAVAALFLLAGTTYADRVPSYKVGTTRDPGVRGDITVPYLTNANSTLGVWNGVAPIIYARPTVSDAEFPGILPVYNLIYYGSKQSFSNLNPGAEPRRANQLRPNR